MAIHGFLSTPLLALFGTALLTIGTFLHPMQADPNVPEAAFAEYAADQHWITSHLMQLLGVWALVGSVILVARRLQDGSAARWASIGIAAGIATIASGLALAYRGFSVLAMAINMPAALVLVVWVIALGVVSERRSQV